MKSEGKCFFCNKIFAQRSISQHLLTHLRKKENEYSGKKRGVSFLVKVKAEDMFLILWVDGKTTYGEIDLFLGNIWLDCCGHLSSFTEKPSKPGNEYNPESVGNFLKGMVFGNDDSDDYLCEGEINKETTISDNYSKGKKIKYDYDFGSTTSLDIILADKINIPATSSIVLLSRNEPLEILCNKCKKKAAVEICTIHYDVFCEDCVQKHKKECSDFEDYASLPVVNSPRMGVCAYEGGSIDTERDGVFQK